MHRRLPTCGYRPDHVPAPRRCRLAICTSPSPTPMHRRLPTCCYRPDHACPRRCRLATCTSQRYTRLYATERISFGQRFTGTQPRASRRLPRPAGPHAGCQRAPGVRRSAVQHRLRLRFLRRPAGGRRLSQVVEAVDGGGGPGAPARRHLLARHWRRIRRRTQGDRHPRTRLHLPKLGGLVLHVWRPLQVQVRPLPRPPLPVREESRNVHVQH